MTTDKGNTLNTPHYRKTTVTNTTSKTAAKKCTKQNNEYDLIHITKQTSAEIEPGQYNELATIRRRTNSISRLDKTSKTHAKADIRPKTKDDTIMHALKHTQKEPREMSGKLNYEQKRITMKGIS